MDLRLLRKPLILAVLTAAAAITGLLPVAGFADAGARLGASASLRMAQLPRYSASGFHQCGSASSAGRSCVVTGLFQDCNEAAIALRTRDCCPTTPGGGKSSGFTLTYCIPDYSSR